MRSSSRTRTTTTSTCPSLEKLGKKLPVVVPRGLGGLLRKRRFESVLEVDGGRDARDRRARDPRRPGRARPQPGPVRRVRRSLGYVISGSKSIYFAGDTDLFDGMGELGPVDVGLIPIWGWGPGLGGGGHLDPTRAAEAVARIRPEARDPDPLGHVLPHPPRAEGQADVRRYAAARVRGRVERSRAGCRASRPASRRGLRALGGRKQLGGRERRDRLFADLARDLRDVGAERGVGDDVQPGGSLGDVADLDVDREVVSLRNVRRPPRS